MFTTPGSRAHRTPGLKRKLRFNNNSGIVDSNREDLISFSNGDINAYLGAGINYFRLFGDGLAQSGGDHFGPLFNMYYNKPAAGAAQDNMQFVFTAPEDNGTTWRNMAFMDYYTDSAAAGAMTGRLQFRIRVTGGLTKEFHISNGVTIGGTNLNPGQGNLAVANVQMSGVLFDTSSGSALTQQLSLDVDNEGRFINFDGNGSFGMRVATYHPSLTPGVGDFTGGYIAVGKDSGGNDATYGTIDVKILDPTDTTEDGEFVFRPIVAGAQNQQLAVSNGVIVGSGTAYPGTGNLSIPIWPNHLVFGDLSGAAADNGGGVVIARDDKANTPFTGYYGWDNGTTRHLYLGGGGWSQPDATNIRFYTAPSYSETNDTGTVKLRIDGTNSLFFTDIGTQGDLFLFTGHGIRDDSLNELLIFTKTTSAINYLNITNSISSVQPSISAAGDDTNIGIRFNTKGNPDTGQGGAFYFNTGGVDYSSTFWYSSASTAGGPGYIFVHDSSTPAAGDDIAWQEWRGNDSIGNENTYASIYFKVDDTTAAADYGSGTFYTCVNGANFTPQFTFADGVSFGTRTTNPGTGNVAFQTGKGIYDDAANEQLIFGQTASAINYVKLTNAAASANPTFSAQGDDTNIGLNFNVKGSPPNSASQPAFSFYVGNSTGNLQLSNTNSAASAPTINIYQNSSSPAANDTPGRFEIWGNDSNGADNPTVYASMEATINDTTDTSEDGMLSVKAMVAGTLTTGLIIGNGVSVSTADYSPGTGKLLADSQLIVSPVVVPGTETFYTVDGFSVNGPAVEVLGGGAAGGTIGIGRYSNVAYGSFLVFNHSRATGSSSGGILSADDYLGAITFNGSDGVTQSTGANIKAKVDGTPGADDMPGRLEFLTSPDGSDTPLVRMTIKNDGGVIFGSGTTSPGADSLTAGGAVIGTPTFQTMGSVTPVLQVNGTSANTTAVGVARWSNDANFSRYEMAKSRGTSIGSHGIVADVDVLGQFLFLGDDGTNFIQGASIYAAIDGTPGTNDMPTRLVFTTTPDGSSSGVTRMTLKPDGGVIIGTGTTSPGAGNLQLTGALFGGTSFLGTIQGSGGTGNSWTPNIQMNGTSIGAASQVWSRWSNSATTGAFNIIAKSRGTSVGDYTATQSGDLIGGWYWNASDGTDFETAAAILGYVDGTPGHGTPADMPGRLVFQTTPDGSDDPVTRMTIKNDGGVIIGTGTTSPGAGSIDVSGSVLVNSVRTWKPVVKGTDETVSGSATLQDDDELTFAVAASTKYRFRGTIFVSTTAAADFKMQFTGPASPTLVIADVRVATNNLGIIDTLTTAFSTVVSTDTFDSTTLAITFEGILHNSTNAGSVTLQWSQATSDASNTTVHAGSYLEYEQV
jgi:hypothetical protein